MQSATDLREQAARCARIAATLHGADAAAQISIAREALMLADEMDGGAKPNGHDVHTLIEMTLAGNNPSTQG